MVTVTRTTLLAATLFIVSITAVSAADALREKQLSAAATADHRSAENQARNASRHPVETLAFFGIQDDMTVVEISPGGGWYTEILAPYLRDNGSLYEANYDADAAEEYYRRNAKKFLEKLAADPEVYDRVVPTVFDPPKKLAAAPPGSADLVLSFRNLHNWMEEGSSAEAFAAMNTILKPGGMLGIVQHRQNSNTPQDPTADSGYVREDYVIALAAAAGFSFAARSNINANPKDTKDHPEGVWTLPPTFELGKTDRDKYASIGESDRMTLKFIKNP